MNRLRLLTLLICLASTCMAATRSHVIRVKAGDAKSLIESLEEANKLNADTLSERTYVLIPDGTYDLGETSLTTISGHNIALIGQSMEKTIIVNAPKVENEGISKTATLLNRGWGTYVQDLTLKNALDYYNSGPAGRAVCWQDKGNRTIFKRVRMLSYQDTYYSHSLRGLRDSRDGRLHLRRRRRVLQPLSDSDGEMQGGRREERHCCAPHVGDGVGLCLQRLHHPQYSVAVLSGPRLAHPSTLCVDEHTVRDTRTAVEGALRPLWFTDGGQRFL